MVKAFFLTQVVMLIVCIVTGILLEKNRTIEYPHDAILLNITRAYLMGYAADLNGWYLDELSQTQASDIYRESITLSEDEYPIWSSIGAGAGFLMSLPMLLVYLAIRKGQKPKIRFYLGFWLSWCVLSAYHTINFVKTGAYVPFAYEWVLFPIISTACGIYGMVVTPERFRRRF